jgi:adenine-specific DNA methylase
LQHRGFVTHEHAAFFKKIDNQIKRDERKESNQEKPYEFFENILINQFQAFVLNF